MVHGKESKTAVLVTVLVIVVLSLLPHDVWGDVGLYAGAPCSNRFLYPLFHASFIHALVNSWCLLSIVFIHEISIWLLLTAYMVAVLVPVPLLSEVPTVGCSCACFFLLGALIPKVRWKCRFVSSVALCIAVGFLFPSVNALVHLYGFLAGLVVSFFNMPLPCLSLRK